MPAPRQVFHDSYVDRSRAVSVVNQVKHPEQDQIRTSIQGLKRGPADLLELESAESAASGAASGSGGPGQASAKANSKAKAKGKQKKAVPMEILKLQARTGLLIGG